MKLELNPIAEEIHREKYRSQGEDYRSAMTRIAATLASEKDGGYFEIFRTLLLEQRFLPAGRIQAGIGAKKEVTAFNCFVSGTIADSFVDGENNIMDIAKEAAATMRKGGGIGYDFSTLRPRGSLIKKLSSKASGPVSFLNIFNAICNCVASSGHRRGAQMGVIRVDHPDILEYIDAKNNNELLTGFNLSIAVTDEFMRAESENASFPLRFNGEIYSTVNARDLYNKIMAATWDWAEPGILFIDRINNANNLNYIETIAATNPCGEQPLPPHGACLLGSFNLTKYLKFEVDGFKFDMDSFKEHIPVVVAMMDNVIDKTIYPLPQQEKEAKAKRRMGLGVTGVANALEVMGYPYGSPAFLESLDSILKTLANEAYRASAELAKLKSPFPLYEEKYLNSEFIQKLDPDVRELIKENGIRNSHLTSIAPTGTISLAANNVSSGIEPVFSLSQNRTIRKFEGEYQYNLKDYGFEYFNVSGKTSDQLGVEDHLNVLIVASNWVDSAVSKTCNVGSSVTFEEFKEVYRKAWRGNCKGCTTFRMDGKRFSILSNAQSEKEETGLSCRIDPITGRKECD